MGILIKLFAIIPVSGRMRGRLYRLFYTPGGTNRIGKNFKIGFGSYIDSNEITIGENVSIGNLVRIKYLDRISIGDNTSIGSSTIVCGAYDHKKWLPRILEIGKDCEILSSHYFDVVAPITIGNHVTIAGKWTQFYTHSFDLEKNRMDGPISIGDHVYIGAGCIINLGVRICGRVVLQAGTCVNKSITEPGVYMSNSFTKRGEVRSYGKYRNDSNKETHRLQDGSVIYREKDIAETGHEKNNNG